MPNMNSIEFIEKVKTIDTDALVIFITAKSITNVLYKFFLFYFKNISILMLLYLINRGL